MSTIQNNTEESTRVCEECGGFCCNYHIARPLKTNHDMIKYWEHRRSPNFERVEDIEDSSRWVYVVDEPCPQYQDGKCAVYKDRSKTCRDFPLVDWKKSTWELFCPLLKKLDVAYKEPKNVMYILK